MKPGRELDKKIAETIGQRRVSDCPLDDDCPGKYEPQLGPWPCLPPYSTNISAAMAAFEWLEENNPWVYLDRWGGEKAHLLLGRKDNGVAVYVMRSYWDSSNLNGTVNLSFIAETYPHAICLAVLASRDISK